MKTTIKILISAASAMAAVAVVSGVQAAPVKHRVRHRPATHHKPQYVPRFSGRAAVVTAKPVPRQRKIPTTPLPQTPGANPATPPIAPGSSGDTRTPMTPPGVGGTGVPGGPGTQP